MAIFYNSNDLLVRRADTMQWLCDMSVQITNHHFYGKLCPANALTNYEYVQAALEAVTCYVPITDSDDDGVTNCLTEAQLDQLFENISIITGLCWQGKNVTYRNAPTPTDEYGQIGDITLTTGEVLGLSAPASG